ncbi:hypothetical protein [Gracilimonas sp.]|uniref:hypothetical protein n=1 Tax=Gracilimonas sp. TaxID=1974203 RepID=UPI003BAC28DC
MTDTQSRYIELFFTAIKTSSYSDIEPKPAVYIDYLSLNELPEEYLKQVRSKFDGSSKEQFQKKLSINDLSKSLRKKVKALHQIIDRINYQNKKTIPHAVINSEKALSKVYNFYIKKRAHKYESDVILFEISEENTLNISNMLQIIGKEYLQLQVIKEIDEHLEFNEYYSKQDKKIVKKSADACNVIRQQLEKNSQSITIEELLKKVLNEFYIKKYANKSAQERKKLTKKAVFEWNRVNQYDCIKN